MAEDKSARRGPQSAQVVAPAQRDPIDAAGPPRARAMLGQERASSAWGFMTERNATAQGDRYTTLVRKLPSYLQGSGLGQTFAFLHSKSQGRESPRQSAEAVLLRQLGDYLARYLGQAPAQEPMALILRLDPAEYRRATRELMLLAEWMKRFVRESAP